MIAVVGRAANLASALKGANQTVASGVKAAVAGSQSVIAQDKPCINSSGSGFLQKNGVLTVSSGIGVGSQIRCIVTETPDTFKEIRNPVGSGHYDITNPNFDSYRLKAGLNPAADPTDSNEQRKAFSYMLMGTGFAATAYMAKHCVRGLVNYLGPAADCLALGTIEIKLEAIPEGKSMTFKWRGKPLFIKHRTEAEIKKEKAEDLTQLKDPQHDNDRVVDPRFLIVIGICTHLGCVPIANAGDYGGYYCPCHGSHYDGSGRIRKGPAPLNLEIPPYRFPEPGIVLVG